LPAGEAECGAYPGKGGWPIPPFSLLMATHDGMKAGGPGGAMMALLLARRAGGELFGSFVR